METKTDVAVEQKVEKSRLERLGMKRASENSDKAQKMVVAYGKYLFVSEEKINAFNSKLRDDSREDDGRVIKYKELVFTRIEDYPFAPPASVLDALESAMADKCFDYFTVAKIEWKEEVKDPILFGGINGCTDLFFISQWDDDVKFEDILFTEVK